eukprot:gene56664-biopygen45347
MVSFDAPQPAVLFGIGVQEALLCAQWPEDPTLDDDWQPQYDANDELIFHGIRVRIGVSYGEVKSEQNPITGRADYRGPAVNLAARLEHGHSPRPQGILK